MNHCQINFIMQEEGKWKYSKQNFNLSSNNYDDDIRRELLANIDQSKKEELKDIFENAINSKYDLYKRYLFENNLFLFSDLKHNISDSVYCLMIGAHTASITNTNLILERAIKLALIQHQAGELKEYSDDEIIDNYIENNRKFSGKNLDQNIQTCRKCGILNKEEAKELKEYKIKFRDGFSHFTPKNILKGESSLIHIEGLKNKKLDKYLTLPISQAMEVRQFAINNAEEHLKFVLRIINHLQFKVLEKFSEKTKNTCI